MADSAQYAHVSTSLSPKALRLLLPDAERLVEEAAHDAHTNAELLNWRNLLLSTLQRYPEDELGFLA